MSTQHESDQEQRKIITGRDYYEYVNGDIYHIQNSPGSAALLQMPGLPPPPQLPLPIEHFTNRNAELAQLLHDLQPRLSFMRRSNLRVLKRPGSGWRSLKGNLINNEEIPQPSMPACACPHADRGLLRFFV